MKRLIGALVVVHRWMGLAFCLIFLVWFASGIVMVFRQMPAYTADERLARLEPLDAASIERTPSQALEALGIAEVPARVVLETLGSRPVYRFLTSDGWRSVYGDDGELVPPVLPDESAEIAGQLFPEHRTTARYVDTIDDPDQWTLEHAFHLSGPLHRVSLGDPAATVVYVATTTGDVVLKTDRASRFWGWVGPVAHWFYYRPLRVNGAAWADLIIYGSLAGCVVTLVGLAIGVYRFSIRKRYKDASRSPFVGWMRWHHYAGLLFGFFAFTWTFSGMLSMGPWNWSPGNGPDPFEIAAVSGGGVDVSRFSVTPGEALAEIQRVFRPAALELRHFLDRAHYLAYEPPADPERAARPGSYGRSPARHLLVDADGAAPVVRRGFDREALLAAARAVMPDVPPDRVAWLTEYDAYYYGKGGDRRLPVLRVDYDDRDRTSLYFDAHDGALVQREVTASRVERWLYHGLHSLDVPGLYQSAWLWYPSMVVLSLGGVALSLTSIVVAWRYVTGARRKPRRGIVATSTSPAR